MTGILLIRAVSLHLLFIFMQKKRWAKGRGRKSYLYFLAVLHSISYSFEDHHIELPEGIFNLAEDSSGAAEYRLLTHPATHHCSAPLCDFL